MTELEQRQLAVKEALSWIGTPYHMGACLKGVGVDCAFLVAGIYKAIGMISEDGKVGIFSNDWFAHAKEEKYLLALLKHTRMIAETVLYRSTQAQSGNLILTRAANSKVYNHAGIVIIWPRVVHAIIPCVELTDASTHALWAHRQIAILDPWKKEDAADVR